MQVDREEITNFNFSTGSPSWTDRTDSPGWVGLENDLEPGTHTIHLEAANSGSDILRVDIVAPHNVRFDYTLDDTLVDGSDGERYLNGPQAPLDAVGLKFGDAETIFAIVNGYADIVTMSTYTTAVKDDFEEQSESTVKEAAGDREVTTIPTSGKDRTSRRTNTVNRPAHTTIAAETLARRYSRGSTRNTSLTGTAADSRITNYARMR